MQIIRALFQEERKKYALFQHATRAKIMVVALVGRQIVIQHGT